MGTTGRESTAGISARRPAGPARRPGRRGNPERAPHNYLVSYPDVNRAMDIAAGILELHITAVEVWPVHDPADADRAGQTR